MGAATTDSAATGTPAERRWWPAPYAAEPLDAVVALPPSKSLTNRALVLAALAEGPSTLDSPLRARDTELMAAALRALGTTVADVAYGAGRAGWRVVPADLRGPAQVDCGLAGTVMRFVPPVAALAAGPVTFDGDPRARERPVYRTLTTLRSLGVDVDDGGRGGLPFTVHGRGFVLGGAVRTDASASSQFVSALLLAAARFEHGLDLRHDGPPVPSRPHVAMTLAALRHRGVRVDDEPDRWVVHPGPIGALDVTIEPDLSSAAPFLAAALASGGRVRVRGWPQRTEQAGDAVRGLLATMGAGVARVGDDLVVTGSGTVRPLRADLHDLGELVPVLAALCALADGSSELTGIAHLRGHESDRLAAVAAEVNGLGGSVRVLDDGLRIEPRPLRAGRWHTYADHRMAHAGAVLGLQVRGIQVEDVATTAKTFPGFADAWARLAR